MDIGKGEGRVKGEGRLTGSGLMGSLGSGLLGSLGSMLLGSLGSGLLGSPEPEFQYAVQDWARAELVKRTFCTESKLMIEVFF